MNKLKISLGAIVYTARISAIIESNPDYRYEVEMGLFNHKYGNWGDICDSDKKINMEAIKNKDRVMSAYETSEGRVWIITECGWEYTTVLFPDEY